MHKSSALFKQIFDKQEKNIKMFQNRQIYELAVKNENQYPTWVGLINSLKFQNEKLKKNFENSAEFNSNYLAVPCDMNLDFFLVPNQWIDEIFFVKTVIVLFLTILVQLHPALAERSPDLNHDPSPAD